MKRHGCSTFFLFLKSNSFSPRARGDELRSSEGNAKELVGVFEAATLLKLRIALGALGGQAAPSWGLEVTGENVLLTQSRLFSTGGALSPRIAGWGRCRDTWERLHLRSGGTSESYSAAVPAWGRRVFPCSLSPRSVSTSTVFPRRPFWRKTKRSCHSPLTRWYFPTPTSSGA